MSATPPLKRAAGPVALASLLLVAFNLRPALTNVGPLLHAIEAQTGLSASSAAALTTLPVLCLGLAAASGPLVTARLGANGGVLMAILLVGVGLALRLLGGTGALFAGAAVSAAGIGLAGVLLPGIVKRDFPASAGFVTGLYTMALCIGAAAGAGLSVPLADLLGGAWAPALAAWALPAFLAAAVWIPTVLADAGPTRRAAFPRGLMREPLAWQVLGFMGLQSSLAYILFGWAPAILQDRGLDPLEAGFAASLMSLFQAPAALLVPTLAGRLRDQRGLAVGLLVVTAAAFLAVLYGPLGAIGPAMGVLGAGLGATFGLGLTIIVLRAGDAAAAGALSAMAQAGGYSLAALGPFAFGLVREAGGRGPEALLYCAIALGAAICALGAGRDRVVGAGARSQSSALQPPNPSSGS